MGGQVFTIKDKTIDDVLCDNCECRYECVGSCPAYILMGENTVVTPPAPLKLRGEKGGL